MTTEHVHVHRALDELRLETPSWGYAKAGTRFGAFPQPAAAVDLWTKIEDGAAVHRFTGCCPAVALHIPWDEAPGDDWQAVGTFARERGVSIGAINPNVFQDACYEHGSLCHADAAVRSRALAVHARCVAIMRATGSRDLSLWYADGTSYPGQGDFRARRARLRQGLQAVHGMLDPGMRMLIEYKPFEPAFYHTDLADWGQSALMARACGPQAQVLVDTGHHLPGANIEHIVATLLDERLLGGFHLNARKYADDDLTTGSIDPYQMFLICLELIKARRAEDAALRQHATSVALMFDQCHFLKDPVEATIQSASAMQESWAKAALVDLGALATAQAAHDVVGAEECLKDAYASDVRPILRAWRQAKGLAADPLIAYRQSGDRDRRIRERQGRSAAAGVGS